MSHDYLLDVTLKCGSQILMLMFTLVGLGIEVPWNTHYGALVYCGMKIARYM